MLDQMSTAVASGCHAPWQSLSQGRRIGARPPQYYSAENTVCNSSPKKAVEIESIEGVSAETDAAISLAMGNCLTETDLGIGTKYEVCLADDYTRKASLSTFGRCHAMPSMHGMAAKL